MRRRRHIAALACALGAALSGCADLVDTELGLDATIGTATVDVAAAEVSASVQVTYRVGEHAEDSRQFQPQAIDLFVGDDLIVSMSPSPPPDFRAVVAPGESFTATFEGVATDATDPTALCGAEVRVVFRWIDQTTFEIGMTEALADSVVCP